MFSYYLTQYKTVIFKGLVTEANNIQVVKSQRYFQNIHKNIKVIYYSYKYS